MCAALSSLSSLANNAKRIDRAVDGAGSHVNNAGAISHGGETRNGSVGANVKRGSGIFRKGDLHQPAGPCENFYKFIWIDNLEYS